MDTVQLRENILANHKIQDEIQSFVSGRYMDLASGLAPIPLQRSAKLIIHLIPIGAFKDHNTLDMQTLFRNGIGFYHGDTRLNLNGYLLYYNDQMIGGSTYTQIYRNSVIEYVDTKIMRNQYEEKWYIPSLVMYKEIKQTIANSLQLYKDHGIQTPIYVFITLQDVKKYCLPTPEYLKNQYWQGFGPPFAQHTIQLPEALIEDFETPIQTILKVPLDALWNASGFPYCDYTK